MMKNITCILFCLLSPLLSFGQQSWSLDVCIDYAIRNNLSYQSSHLNLSQSEILKKQAITNRFPSVNTGATHGYNWGQSIDPFTNQFASQRVRTNNLYLSSNWILFSGLQNYYLQEKAINELRYHQYNLEAQKRNLKINVTAHYLQILLNDRKLANRREQMNYTKNVLKRTNQLFNAGQATKYALLEIESQLAQDSLEVTHAVNELRLSQLKLKQFLNLTSEQGFAINTDEKITTPQTDSFSDQFENMPEVKQVEELEKIKGANLKIAKAKLSPTLSLNASLGSGYSENNKEIIGTRLVPKSFGTQIDENFYQSTILSLSVPIYNKGTISSEIASAKIEIQKTEIQKREVLLDLQYKIEQLKIEIENAKANKSTSEFALKAAEKTLELAQMRYEEGIINFIEFLDVQKKYFDAQSQLTNAEYEYLFKLKILFYYYQ